MSIQSSFLLKPTFRCLLFLFCFLVACGEPVDSTEDTAESTEPESTEDTFDPRDYNTIFRRTTLIVRDIEQSLALYRDAIGMEVVYDNLIRRPHKTEDREEVLRLVFLKSVHHYYGVLGLLEYDYEYEGKEDKVVVKEGFTAGHAVLLFNTNDLENNFDKLRNAPGVEVITEPSLRQYPSYKGEGLINVMVSTVYDADGFLVEFNQLLDELK